MEAKRRLIEAAECGKFFEINFKDRRMRVGKEVIIEDGKVKKDYEMCLLSISPAEQIERLESLYKTYKYSVPSERAEHNSKHCCFVALRPDQLTDMELMVGENRLVAKANLEYYVLLMIMSGTKWEDVTGKNNAKHWYWQSNSPYAKELVLLKEWF